MGRFVSKPMTRDEACKILNIEETPELNHVDVMQVISLDIVNKFSDLSIFSRKTTQPKVAHSTFNPKYTLQKNI